MTDLAVLILNCILAASPAQSSSDKLANELGDRDDVGRVEGGPSSHLTVRARLSITTSDPVSRPT